MIDDIGECTMETGGIGAAYYRNDKHLYLRLEAPSLAVCCSRAPDDVHVLASFSVPRFQTPPGERTLHRAACPTLPEERFDGRLAQNRFQVRVGSH